MVPDTSLFALSFNCWNDMQGTGALPAYQIPLMATNVLKQKLEVLGSNLRSEVEANKFD